MEQELVFTNKCQAEILAKARLSKPESGEVLVQTRYSGISWGTESKFLKGLVELDANEVDWPVQAGKRFPLAYGYANV